MVTSIHIVLDHPDKVFLPGDVICASVLLTTDTRLNLKEGIRIKFEGFSRVEWLEDQIFSNQPLRFHYKVIYFRTSLIIPEKKQRDTLSIVSNGLYEFPLKLTVPTNLPSSFESKYGEICYVIKAYFGQPPGYCKTSCLLSVQGSCDLNAHVDEPFLRDPVKWTESVNICSFLQCKICPVFATFSIDKTGFVLGDKIQFSAKICNRTGFAVSNVAVKILQEIVCRTKMKAIKFTNEDCKVSRGDVLPGELILWDDNLTVSNSLAPSRWAPQDIIDISYVLKLSMTIDTMLMQTLEIPIPIVVGTVPLSESPRKLVSHTHSRLDTPSKSMGIETPKGKAGWGYKISSLEQNIPYVDSFEDADVESKLYHGDQD